MGKKKTILVMMSSYNGEKHISEQIDSILNQKTVHDIYLRIRDDGSADGTCDIIEKYVDKYHGQVELIRGENIGYNASFFFLIQNASGYDYYSISDQDDVWLEDKLQTACDAIDRVKKNIPVLYASTSYLVHDDLQPYGTTRKKVRRMSMMNTIIQNICPGHTQVMNNQLLHLIKDDLDTSKIYVYDSWIQNVANLYGKILFDNTPHTYYRQYEGNQLGSGVGKIGQLLASLKRDKTGDGLKYRRQIEYFYTKHKDALKKKNMAPEIKRLITAKKLLDRLKYSVTGKVYRQSKLETCFFYLAVVLGKF